MSPETHLGLKAENLRSRLKDFDLGDSFGQKIETLDNELATLEGKGQVKGWRERLLWYEAARRESWFKLIRDKTKPGGYYNDGKPELLDLTPDYLERMLHPGEVATYEQMLKLVRGKNIRFTKGSYRSIPTPVHIKYLTGGFGQYRYPANFNIVMYDPEENVKILKGSGKIVFPNKLRSEFLRHILGVDVVVCIPSFGIKNPEVFWRHRGREIRKIAKEVEMLGEGFGGELLPWKDTSGFYEIGKVINAGIVPTDVADKQSEEFWATSEWDKVSEGHEQFIELATKILL